MAVQLGQLAQVALLLLGAGACTAGSAAMLRLPQDFMLGVGTSAYQTEGAWNVSGKGVSTLDRAYGGRSDGGGNVATNSYSRYKEDIAMLKLMGVSTNKQANKQTGKHLKVSYYRFSIAWARLLPTGEADNVNPDGVRSYNAVLDELKAAGIEPLESGLPFESAPLLSVFNKVTLFHMDFPAVLDDRFGGWISPLMVDYFETYAVTAFKLFGDKVRYWVTLNEPYMLCVYGHGHGRLGATRVEPGITEYLCGHHMVLAHARAYRAYKKGFSHQGGQIGLTLEDFHTRPHGAAGGAASPADERAAEVHQQFSLGWYLDPLVGRGGRGGEYPELMRTLVDANSARENRARSRLPTFTEEERALLAGALDFLGLNVYFGWHARHGVPDGAGDPSLERDAGYTIVGTHDQFLPPGPFRSTPWVLRASLDWLRRRYGGELPVIITENGFGDSGAEGLQDTSRVEYLRAHLSELMQAVLVDRHNVKGYFAWCLLDDFEWGAGYKSKFGLVHVDFTSGSLKRTPKASLFFYRQFIQQRGLPVDTATVPVPGPAWKSESQSTAAAPAPDTASRSLVAGLGALPLILALWRRA
ncbi:Myrosinase 1 [Frankliniella fusca]|uniref:beta-glucosidase n=1 Tax=Frankliniella fusca TaxID=407009 RepID=A0AAE1HJU9_9NEOP|nr:Myrosinase 1 [Frankliniella fusca]